MRRIPAAIASACLLATLAACANPTPAQQAAAQAAISAGITVVVQSATDPNCAAAIGNLLAKVPAGAVGTACEEDALGTVLKAGVAVVPAVAGAVAPAVPAAPSKP